MGKNIVLTGFMGTGKTATGKRLASRLNMNFIDTDREIEAVTGLKIPEIFRKYGEKRFRSEEQLIVKRIANFCNCVIATGGGVVLNPDNVKLLRKNGIIVLLESRPEIIARRVRHHNVRPLLGKKEDLIPRIEMLLKERAPFYEDYDYKLDTSDLDLDVVVSRIIDFIKEKEPGMITG